ncbi:MAG: glycosyl hydrolase [Actinomycetota bacterium]
MLVTFTILGTVAMRMHTASGATSRPQAKLVPASGALFGAYVDPDNRWVDNQSAEGEVESFEGDIGRKLDIDQHYYSWTNKFPTGLEQWDLSNGRTPLITWMGTDLDTINSGADDDMIRARAGAVAALGQPVFLRWGHEMNGDWYSWSGVANNDAGSTNGPAKFVAAWKHIHRLFDDEGATNVVWVWAVNSESVPHQAWNSWTNYYPGDDFVDWVGIDGYNWGTAQSWSKWTSFGSIFGDVYNDYAASKPIMIAEVGSTEDGGDKGSWISSAASAMRTSFPSIAAFVWFDVDKEQDWRADSSSGAMQAYRSVAQAPYFTGGDTTGGDTTGGDTTGGDTTGGDTTGGDTTGGAVVDLGSVAAAPDSLVDYTRIGFSLDTPARISLRISDAQGNVVRHRLNHAGFEAGSWGVRWHGKDDGYRRVPSGRYTAVVVAFDANGNHVRATTEIDVV